MEKELSRTNLKFLLKFDTKIFVNFREFMKQIILSIWLCNFMRCLYCIIFKEQKKYHKD